MTSSKRSEILFMKDSGSSWENTMDMDVQETTIKTDLQEKALHEIEVLIRARYPLLAVITYEEERVEAELAKLAQKLNKKIFCWSFIKGLYPFGLSQQSQKRVFSANTTDPQEALEEIVKYIDSAIFVFNDFHPYIRENAVVRKLREVVQHLASGHKTLILLSPTLGIPMELEKDISVIDFPLPGLPQLQHLLDAILLELKEKSRRDLDIDEPSREKILKAAQGLTLKEAENSLARALIMNNKLSESEINIILKEKEQAIRKSGLLEFYNTDASIAGVGGLDNLKEYFRKRSTAFTEKARNFGLPPPKGVLLIGVQGCGKSLCAKAISQEWSLPLLRFDVGRVFSSLVGSSEENIRRAIAVAESVAPSLLWIDEIEKAFAGISSSHLSDAGTTSRVFGSFITWLQEKTAAVFVMATANNISILPPELLRKGRFDEIFFVNLPCLAERKEIFAIHIRKKGRDAGKFDIDRLAAACKGFSGAEIEEAIVTGLYDAFYESPDRDTFSDAHILRALNETVPLSKTMAEDIQRLRAWSAQRARPATRYQNDD
jgi:SpoVK/Ycf46/Vps4 family AAA+-type ATPase